MRRRGLRDAVVLITGASSGAGRATALALCEHGAALVLVARGVPRLEAVAAECRARGARVLAVPTDVADPDAVERLRARAVERFGRIDVWIEAAAVLVAGRFGEEPLAEVRRLVDTNVFGSIVTARVAIDQFRAQGGGSLVLVSSMLGIVQNPVVPTYVMSKFAIRGLALSLRHLVAAEPGIDVSLVLPGPIDTPLFERAANHTGFRLRAIPPAISPERVAAALVSCAQRPRRQMAVGTTSKGLLVAERLAPRTTDWIVARATARLIVRHEAAPPTAGTTLDPTASTPPGSPWRRSAWRRAVGDAVGRRLARRGARA